MTTYCKLIADDDYEDDDHDDEVDVVKRVLMHVEPCIH